MASTFPYERRGSIADSTLKDEKQDFLFLSLSLSGYESARLNGFSILLFVKGGWGGGGGGGGGWGGYLPCTPCNVRVQSVIRSERSAGSHQTDSVAPNPQGLHVCVLFVRRRPTASGNSHPPRLCPPPPSPHLHVLLHGDKCCVINFLKLHLLNYAEYHCDSSCISSSSLVFFFIIIEWGGEKVQLGRYCDSGREGGREGRRHKVGEERREGESDGVRGKRGKH